MKRFALCGAVLLSAFFYSPCFVAAQGLDFILGGHKGAVTAVVYDQKRVISAGEDGFLEMWDIKNRRAQERFQATDLPIKAMRLRLGTPHAALLESDGKRHRVSVFDYTAKEKLFALDFNSAPSFINYSAGGSFLIVAKSDRTGVVCIDGDTGEIVYTVADSGGTVTFASTGKSERSMISYLPSGIISYWDLLAGKEIQKIKTVSGLQKPILFGNNRFIAGIGSGKKEADTGLFVIDAVSGKVLDRDPLIIQGSLLSQETGRHPGFVCVSGSFSQKAQTLQTVYEFTVNNIGKLNLTRSVSLLDQTSGITSVEAAESGALIFGAEDGNVCFFNQDGTSSTLAVKNEQRIREIAVSGNSLGALADERFYVIPLDYTLLTYEGAELEKKEKIEELENLEDSEISEIKEIGEKIGKNAHIDGVQNGFILWKEDSSEPLFISEGEFVALPRSNRFSLRGFSTLDDKALFLDSAGNITILSLKSRERLFSFSSAGVLDAAFLDNRNIIIGRGDIYGVAPFLKINIVTGETAPIAYPATVGVRVYRSASGTIYGAAIAKEKGSQKTALVKLDLLNPANSAPIAEYQGEDFNFAFAETQGVAASTFGKTQAQRYTEDGVFTLDQKGGFPRSILDGGRFFISLDTDGVISWIDPQTGTISARLHLYDDEWILEDNGDSIGRGLLNYEKDSSELF